MTTETQQYIELSRKVAAAAQGDTLQPHTAVQFCLHILPRLLVELEIAQRVDALLAERIAFPQEVTAPLASVSKKVATKAKKKKPTPRKKRKATNDSAAS